MAMTVFVLQSCTKCFNEGGLRTAIVLEAEGGYQNAWSLRRKMRYSNELVSKVPTLTLRYRSKHRFAGKFLKQPIDGGKTVSDRPDLFRKAPVFMSYDPLNDFMENKRAQPTSKDFDVLFACKKFPSISFGTTPAVDLYDDSVCFSGSKDPKLMTPDSLGGMWPFFYPSRPCSSSPIPVDDNTSILPLQSNYEGSDSGEEADLSGPFEDSSSANCENAASIETILDKPVSCISGLTKRQRSQLEDCGFHTLRRLLHHFPRTYADLQNPHAGISDDQYLIFVGRILSSRGVKASYSFSFIEVIIAGEVSDSESTSERKGDHNKEGKKTVYLHLKKFFRGARFTSQPFLRSIQQKHREGDIVCVSGKIRSMRAADHYEMREYNLDTIEDGQDSGVSSQGRPYAIHPSKGRLKPQFLRDMITRALKMLPVDVDPIPEDIRDDIGLMHLRNAYIGIHQPKDLNEAHMARKRFIFDEFFYVQLGRLYQMLEGLSSRIEKEGLIHKYGNPELHAIFKEEWSGLAKNFFEALPYSLTASQLSAVSEIIWDLRRPVPMNRLLQGDVGCGKTIVAFLACMEVIGSGYQAAFMVPTELLAIQHYEDLCKLLEDVNETCSKPSITLLTGSTPAKQACLIRKGIQSGDISMVIGTHSLIAECIEFSALRLAVIDEQHRFGVIQRGRFNSKLYHTSSDMDAAAVGETSKNNLQMAPHVLAMSATPIPRTLALALYGDMSFTQITDLPPGRLPVDTHILEENETSFEKVYQMMLGELETGGKVYLVYPVIEQSEQLPQLRAASAELETISKKFPGYCCSLLHGKMNSDAKDEALRRFRHGETQILLSTQVIEIGVDIPDASMMVVMNAERFGIAQLHQLRGRVGRGSRKSKCILVASTSSCLSRLKVLENSSDGFHLANVDLLLRGPGDLLGKKQSGHLPEFPVTKLEMDGNILQAAHVAALKILDVTHDLNRFPALKVELSMRQPLSLLGD